MQNIYVPTRSIVLFFQYCIMPFELDVTGTDRFKIQIDADWSKYGIVDVKVE